MKRRLILTLVGVVLGFGALWLWLSRDTCGAWPRQQAALSMASRGKSAPQVGAAKVDFTLPFPVPIGGYGPPHHSVSEAATPLSARALVLNVGGQQKALVLLDVMLITPQLRDLIARGFPFSVIVIATHTHSGPGAYSRNSAEEWAALGSFSPAVEEALAKAGRDAVSQALGSMKNTHLETAHADTENITVPRTGKAADTRYTRLLFVGDAGPVAQLLIVAAHPTLVERDSRLAAAPRREPHRAGRRARHRGERAV